MTIYFVSLHRKGGDASGWRVNHVRCNVRKFDIPIYLKLLIRYPLRSKFDIQQHYRGSISNPLSEFDVPIYRKKLIRYRTPILKFDIPMCRKVFDAKSNAKSKFYIPIYRKFRYGIRRKNQRLAFRYVEKNDTMFNAKIDV